MFKLSSLAEESSLETCSQILQDIYHENPKHWPCGLTVGHHDDLYLIRDKQSNAPVGFVSFQKITDAMGELIGYYTIGMKRAYRGLGMAKEALEKMLLEKSGEVKEVRAFIVNTNTPSMMLANRLGIPIVIKESDAKIDRFNNELQAIQTNQLARADGLANNSNQVALDAEKSNEMARNQAAQDTKTLQQDQVQQQKELTRQQERTEDREDKRLERVEVKREKDIEKAEIHAEKERDAQQQQLTDSIDGALERNRYQQEQALEAQQLEAEQQAGDGEDEVSSMPMSMQPGNAVFTGGMSGKSLDPYDNLYSGTGFNTGGDMNSTMMQGKTTMAFTLAMTKCADLKPLLKMFGIGGVGAAGGYGYSKALEGTIPEDMQLLAKVLNIPTGALSAILLKKKSPAMNIAGVGGLLSLPLKDVGLVGAGAIKEFTDQVQPTVQALETASREIGPAAKDLARGSESFAEGMASASKGKGVQNIAMLMAGLGILGYGGSQLYKAFTKPKRRSRTSTRPRRRGRIRVELDPTPELIKLIGMDIAQVDPGEETHIDDRRITLYKEPRKKAATWFRPRGQIYLSLEKQAGTGTLSTVDPVAIRNKVQDAMSGSGGSWQDMLMGAAAKGIPYIANKLFFEPYVQPMMESMGIGAKPLEEEFRVGQLYPKNSLRNDAHRLRTLEYITKNRNRYFSNAYA